MKASELVEKLISEYQRQADEMTAVAKDCCGDDATVSRYKWMHSLAAAYKKMVADLDTVAAQLETPQLPDTREKLVELLSEYFDIGDSYAYNLTRVKSAFACGTMGFDDFEEFDEETVEDIAAHLIAHSVTVQEWISIKDRLPELIPCNAGTAYSEAVNVLTDGRKVMTAIWDGTTFLCDADYWEAWDEKITHWTPVLLPLPEPPKED